MPKGLEGLRGAVQPITGPSSIDAALAALSPEEQALALAGIDPMGGDAGMMGGQPAVSPEMMAQTTGGLSPADRVAIAENLAGILAALGAPQNESDAAVSTSIQNAIMALGVQ